MIFIRPKISVKPAVKRKRSMAQDKPLNNCRKTNCTGISLQIIAIQAPSSFPSPLRDCFVIFRSPFDKLRVNGEVIDLMYHCPFVVSLSNHERTCDTVSQRREQGEGKL
jgi:hypothetical protein